MIIIGYLALIIDFVLSKHKNNHEGVGVGGVKRGHKLTHTSNVNMIDVYEGRDVLDSEPTTILFPGKYVLLIF